jgi:Flp pilus assembly protein TadD
VSRTLGWRTNDGPGEPIPELNPAKTAEVQFALGRTLEQQGKWDQARVAYESSLRHDPKNGLACWRLAVLAARAGNAAAADRNFGRAVELLPESAEIHTDMGYSHYLRGELETATMHLRQAIVLHEGHDRAHNILGLVLAMQGHDIDAAREFSAAGLEPADIACNLGYVAMRSGNSDTADEMFAHALELVPGHTTAQRYFTVSATDAGARPKRVQHTDWIHSPGLSARNVHHAVGESIP